MPSRYSAGTMARDPSKDRLDLQVDSDILQSWKDAAAADGIGFPDWVRRNLTRAQRRPRTSLETRLREQAEAGTLTLDTARGHLSQRLFDATALLERLAYHYMPFHLRGHGLHLRQEIHSEMMELVTALLKERWHTSQ